MGLSVKPPLGGCWQLGETWLRAAMELERKVVMFFFILECECQRVGVLGKKKKKEMKLEKS